MADPSKQLSSRQKLDAPNVYGECDGDESPHHQGAMPPLIAVTRPVEYGQPLDLSRNKKVHARKGGLPRENGDPSYVRQSISPAPVIV